jgi:hypothetical protein
VKIDVSELLDIKAAIDALMALDRNSDSQDIHRAKMAAINGELAIKYILLEIKPVEVEVTK